jgi:phosphohistidine phosphatase
MVDVDAAVQEPGMKTLYLLRHAKSDWSDGALSDHARPLNARGRTAAPLIAAYLKNKSYLPDLILCSTARRTVETLDLIKPVLPTTTLVRYEDALYLAEPEKLLERVRWVENAAASVMLIGHNPGTELLAASLSGPGKTAAEKARLAAMREKYPTAALAVLKFPANDWREVSRGAGALADFVRPKDLDGIDSD